MRSGAVPVFADIDPDTFDLNPASVSDRVTERTRALLPVHLFGRAADLTALQAIADRAKLAVVEDAAQGFGAEHAEAQGRAPLGRRDLQLLSREAARCLR